MSYKHIVSFFVLLSAFLFVSCQTDNLEMTAKGRLHLNIHGISSETTETRSTPAELKEKNGLSVSDFQLSIVRQGYDAPLYYDKVPEEEIELPIGPYDITATYGENPFIGRDTPYYIGTTTTTVEEDQTTEVTLTCKVGNALVSVIFGEDETQAARFEKFYSSYKLHVHVSNYSMEITNEEPTSSIYLRAGSDIKLSFSGVLREENGRTVSCELDDESLPSSLNAGEHLIVTLNPDEAKTAVNIHKAEVKTVTLEETIPLSWLPVAAAMPIHQYDKNGNLVGTNVTFTDAFPGMEWEAIVTNTEGTTVRGISGTGTLTSKYENNETWPYLPEGEYTATYYLITEEGKMKTNSREFIVHAPQLKFSLGGYSSYTKYLEGDIDAANECNANTIYEPSVKINISPDLLALAKYSTVFTYNLNGTTDNITGNDIALNNFTGLAPRSEAYPLDVSITFGGTTISDKRDFFITGLPVEFMPPTQADWSVAEGDVKWEESDVRLGNWSWSQPHEIICTNFAIPEGTKISASYYVNVYQATVGTTLSLYVGEDKYFSGSSSYMKGTDYKGSKTFTTTNYVSSIKASNSYGSGDTHSLIYSLGFKYGE